MSPDLGLDQIKVYKIEDDSALKKVADLKLPAGSGPRHIDIHPNNQCFYVFGELDNTISTLLWDNSKKTST
jgi:6-phosphogluconolactonase